MQDVESRLVARVASHGHSEAKQGEQKRHQQQRRRRHKQDRRQSEHLNVDRCVFENVERYSLAELYIQAFMTMHQAGMVVRSRVVNMVRTWVAMSRVCGVDVTWGVAKALCSALDVSPIEVEGEEMLLLDHPEILRHVQAERSLLAAETARIKASVRAEYVEEWLLHPSTYPSVPPSHPLIHPEIFQR